MSFVRLTRPDGSSLTINAVIRAAPVPARGALATGTPIVFRNRSHQDVRELLDEAISRIGAARSARAAVFAAPMPVTCGTSRTSRS